MNESSKQSRRLLLTIASVVGVVVLAGVTLWVTTSNEDGDKPSKEDKSSASSSSNGPRSMAFDAREGMCDDVNWEFLGKAYDLKDSSSSSDAIESQNGKREAYGQIGGITCRLSLSLKEVDEDGEPALGVSAINYKNASSAQSVFEEDFGASSPPPDSKRIQMKTPKGCEESIANSVMPSSESPDGDVALLGAGCLIDNFLITIQLNGLPLSQRPNEDVEYAANNIFVTAFESIQEATAT